MKTAARPPASSAKPPRRSPRAGADRLLVLKIGAARRRALDKKLLGSPSQKVSARVSAKLLKAAMKRSGITEVSAVIETGLALMAEPDDFGEWLVLQAGKLPADFELVR
jgi:hypothetical protein